jgi:hypothetical protein
MLINQARQKAARFLEGRVIAATARRPPPDERVMVRYPQGRNGKIIAASDEETLQERLAKKIQAQARRDAARH